MVSTPPEPSLLEALEESDTQNNRRFSDLRGLRWRIDLGILPSSPSLVDDLRRVTADSRRRYAALRRHLLIDSHTPKDGSNSPEPVIDNPLSQNPDSMWGRFFRNAELERVVDQDLSRLYPEHGSYFQTPGCQAMLRRILLLWCLRHPNYGYQQGMHELLAPLLYVLHADVEYLSEVQELYEEHFNDKFDGFSFHESNLMYKFDFKKFFVPKDGWNGSQKVLMKGNTLNDLDDKIQDIILLSDAYGAEGELGIVVSEKFMEHDAYCMFDALMNGAGGAVALADYFNSCHLSASQSGIPPVIVASSALYHLLSIVDSSLHCHLVELGVEPQYFALRWLRVLFGREFALQDLLIIWDEIFAFDNSKFGKYAGNGPEFSSGILSSPRGAFICGFSVSMILQLRSSLLATENATFCLKRLLNFPEEINLRKLIRKAKSLQTFAVDAFNSMPSLEGTYGHIRPTVTRHHNLSFDTASPTTPLNLVAESYWEEKWRVLHKEQENNECSPKKQAPNRIKSWSQKVKSRLTRTESDPSPAKNSRKVEAKASVRRSLLQDLARQLGSDEDIGSMLPNEILEHKDPPEVDGDDGMGMKMSSADQERCLSVSSEDNSSMFCDAPSLKGEANDNENQSESSVVSNTSIDDNMETNNLESYRTDSESSPLPVSCYMDAASCSSVQDDKDAGKAEKGSKEQKVRSGKFQWFWKFGWHTGEEAYDKGGSSEATKACREDCNQNKAVDTPTVDASDASSSTSKGELVDQNALVTMRNLGQSMLENIQVIESAFQQERGQVRQLENFSRNVLVGKGQAKAMSALKELRKISNLLSEM